MYFLWAVFRFRFISCFQIKSFGGRFIFLHLCTLPRSDFPGSHGTKKTFPICFVLSELTTKFFEFFVFSFMAYGNLATSPTRLETELTNITRRHFCSLPVVCIEHSFIYFLLSIFSFRYLFVSTYFDSSRQHTRQGR